MGVALCPSSVACHAPGIPGPTDALRREQIADGLIRLRRDGGRIRRIRQSPVTVRGRLVGARLVGRLHGIDRVEIRRQVAVFDEAGRPVESRLGRVFGKFESDAIGFHGGDLSPGGTLVGMRVLQDTGAGEPDVIHKGTDEDAHEEIVGQHKLFGHAPHAHLRPIVVAHGERARIGKRREAIVLAAIDLHLVLIEAMYEVSRDNVQRLMEPVRIIDGKWRIRQMRRVRLGDGRNHACRGEAVPYRRQFLERRTVAIQLGGAACLLQSVGARKGTIQNIEAAVFGENHHDVVDAGQALGAQGH